MYTLVAYPDETANDLRTKFQRLGKGVSWTRNAVVQFVLNSFHHDFGTRESAFGHISDGGRMLYGDFIFSATSGSDNVTRQPSTIRIAKHFSIGNAVAVVKVYAGHSKVVAQYLAFCLTSSSMSSTNDICLETAKNNVLDMLNASEKITDALFKPDFCYFVANYLIETALRHLSQSATVYSAEDFGPIPFCKGYKGYIDSYRFSHKYFSIQSIKKTSSKFFSFSLFKERQSRKLFYRTFIPFELVKDIELKEKGIQNDLRFFIWEALVSCDTFWYRIIV